MNKKLIVVVGAGSGVGNHVAKKFGYNNFRVVLVSRNQNALDQYVKELRSEGIETYAVAADAASSASLTSAFEQIKKKYGTIDVLVYNAAVLKDGQPTSLTAESLVSHYQVDVAGALHAAQQVIPDQVAQKEGTILFTGGGFALQPTSAFAALSIGKAALRTLALTLAEELKPQGVFVGTVTIAGTVAPGTHFAPELIAEKYWELYEKRGEHEIVYS
ncbi:SDR family NAD(P)-dependent oxidoreductase [Priestia megaterium]|uniref:SDR family NAD(P)-dependent oxidoreductase n=1 Tax=Priestia megaterium TaxID=1404 RepID=A0ABD4X2D6_PRIMG|nr:SDR family NAD(P)-dependent oxidoreductase [Priestia megaterium]KRF46351.1 short-chain dehydrogenase [Bacillus sp. Soil531]MDD9786705.1 SDR family NAD(P)-dependent oxidoreductase [Priestia megaterium]PES95269.1 short-chain dehydrogenase [Priestia megaterium]PGO53748.1 short-chain dehydrogenase [Priestia megaterium]